MADVSGKEHRSALPYQVSPVSEQECRPMGDLHVTKMFMTIK